MPADDEVEIDGAEADRIGRIMGSMDESDLDLLEPSAGVWEGIDASVTKVAPARDTPPGVVVEYRITADDIVVGVGGAWADFATDNAAPELVEPDPARTLWSYMSGDETVELWQLVVQRVRTLQIAAQVPLRCDGPHARRWFEVTVSPGPDREVHFRSVLVFEEARDEIALLAPHAGRDAEVHPVAVCSWCGRGEHHGDWHDIEQLVAVARLLERQAMPPLAYGICGGCRDQMSAELLIPGRANPS